MAASNEWTDWHLTPKGWERGTEKDDFNRVDRDPPSDRVLSSRFSEYAGSVHSTIERTSSVTWSCKDSALINALLEKFGQPPEHL
ncbi:MAG: hypothetical protein ACN6OP_14445 [Pseudomonadales bacterium]